MAYYKRSYKRSNYRRKPYKRYRTRTGGTLSSIASLANTAYNTANFVKSIVNTEYKFLDKQITLTGQNSTWNFSPLCNMAQGDDISDRNGRSILAKSLYLQLKVSLQNPTVDGSAVARLIIVRDNTCDGTVPVFSDIFADPGGSDLSVMSFRNILDSPTNKYTIVYDKRFSLDVDFKDEVYSSKYIKFNNQHVKFLGTTATSSDFGPGMMWLAVIATGTASSGIAPVSVEGYSRFRYIDN